MFKQEDVEIIAAALPCTAVALISRRTKISRPTVYRFLQGKSVRPHNEERIYQEALRLIEKDRECTRKLKEQLTKILNQPV